MKKYLLLFLMILLAASPAVAQDAREAVRKATEEKEAALRQAKEIEENILEDKTALRAEVAQYEERQKELESRLAALNARMATDEARRKKLEEQWSKRELEFKEISGNVRVVARDLESMLQQSPLTALRPGRLKRIAPLLEKGYFPGIDDISGMTAIFFDEIKRSGQVSLQQGRYVGRDGEDRSGTIMMLGTFTAIYSHEKEVGFLTYSQESNRLFALSALPSSRTRKMLRNYLAGKTEVVPFDMSQGAALRHLTQRKSLVDQLRDGGPIVWPIGLIALVALGIVINRFLFLNRVARNTGKYMTRVNKLAAEGNWNECDALVKRHKGEHSPVNHVIEAGINARSEDRETLESILQEAILRELPRVERGLTILAVLGAIAPLLGLLGTVTGMIDTFRVITLFGTGDPKLMSGGISEALVTTEVGLAVAIPIMLVHTLLSRRVDFIIGEMEEKAISLTNIIQRERSRNGHVHPAPSSSLETLATEPA